MPEVIDMLNEVEKNDNVEQNALMQAVIKYMIRDAKANGVPAARAELLVNDIVGLYNVLVATKFTFTVQVVFNRFLKLFYDKVQK